MAGGPGFEPGQSDPDPMRLPIGQLLCKGPAELVDMCLACKYANHMSKMIQLRNVPDNLHRKLKARAALEGVSLSDYLLAEIRRAAARPTLGELLERLRQRKRVSPRLAPAEAVRAERDGR